MILVNDCRILQSCTFGGAGVRGEVGMNQPNSQQMDYEAQRMGANRAELVERIASAHGDDGSIEPLPGLHLNRLSHPRGPLHNVTVPSFCVIAQGSKEVLLGDSSY